ncbi:MAG: winged helix-turn-helix transcriptional regulator [bacterium]|nr:winged helix-turn-helix transcriptional regulator [bacterium]
MDHIEKFLKAISDKNRIRIIKLLENNPMCVCELAAILETTQPNVSKHLKKLKNIGIIGSEQNGFWTNYFLIQQDNLNLKIILNNISNFLKNDKVIKEDLKKYLKIDRKDICRK